MSLFTLLKITRTRYLLGSKRVSPGTPNAVRVDEESKHWYAYRRDGKKQVKVRLFTDKAASMSKMAKMNTALERGEAEMTDPRKEHLERAALEHLEEFLPVMRENGKSEKDKDRKEAILRAFAADLKSLSELTHAAVDRYLGGVKGSAGNKKKHLSAISVWVAWLMKKDRIAANPLDRVDVPNGEKKTKERRALSVPQIQKLLDATRLRPMVAFVDRYGDRSTIAGRLFVKLDATAEGAGQEGDQGGVARERPERGQPEAVRQPFSPLRHLAERFAAFTEQVGNDDEPPEGLLGEEREAGEIREGI